MCVWHYFLGNFCATVNYVKQEKHLWTAVFCVVHCSFGIAHLEELVWHHSYFYVCGQGIKDDDVSALNQIKDSRCDEVNKTLSSLLLRCCTGL